MLTGKKLVVIGGDARQVEVIAQLSENDASTILVGFDHLEKSFVDSRRDALTEQVLKTCDALVFPVAGMDDDGRVDTKFADGPVYLTEEHFSMLREGTHVFTGIARPYLTELCHEHSLTLVRLMELDEVAILNSIPTAEGAIAMAMEKTDITLHGASIVVLGFGRCGQTLARTLNALGSHVTVCARDAAHLARIREMGLNPVDLRNLDAAAAHADVLFNTIPSLVLSAAVLKHMRQECVIIDLASKPGGTDFRYAERRGMTAVLAPSLPGVVAPKTAGRIIAASICRTLASENEVRTSEQEDIPWS